MTGKFKDLTDVFQDYLELPIDGVTWRINAPSAQVGLRAHAMFQLGQMVALAQQTDDPSMVPQLTDEQRAFIELDDIEETTLFRQLLGSTYDEMVEAGVSGPQLAHIGRTVFMWVGSDYNDDVTAAFWNGDEPGKALVPNRADRRHPTTSTSTAAASTTPRRVSGSSTTSRKAGSKRWNRDNPR